MTSLTPSPEQTLIFDHSGNIIVEAVAGSGKTTTIVEKLKRLPSADGLVAPAILFLAFNKQIAETLKARCPAGVNCSTFHALGFRALRNSRIVEPNVKVDGRKVSRLVWNKMERENPDVRDVIKLVGLAKGSVGDPNFREIAARHEIDITPKSFEVAERVFLQSSTDTSTIDYDDMLWMSVNFNARFDTQSWVFVDEAQDTNDIQVEILARLEKQSPKQRAEAYVQESYSAYVQQRETKPIPSPTTFVIVGDPHQAIYGFRGANSDSMDKLKARFNCTSFPLSVSYRCPKAVVNEARKYVTI